MGSDQNVPTTGPIVVTRDHLDAGSVASPYRETEGKTKARVVLSVSDETKRIANGVSGAPDIDRDGDVDFARFLDTLDRIGYTGPLTIEREIPQEPARQKAEIGRAIELLKQLKLRFRE